MPKIAHTRGIHDAHDYEHRVVTFLNYALLDREAVMRQPLLLAKRLEIRGSVLKRAVIFQTAKRGG